MTFENINKENYVLHWIKDMKEHFWDASKEID